MRLLLDSHVVLWWMTGHSSLGAACQAAVAGADQVYVSAITPWELGIKKARGRLAFPDPMLEALIAVGMTPLAITVEHAQRAAALPLHHQDPFDRMLVAQAQLESLELVSADRRLRLYDVPIVDPRT